MSILFFQKHAATDSTLFDRNPMDTYMGKQQLTHGNAMPKLTESNDEEELDTDADRSTTMHADRISPTRATGEG